MSHGDRNLTPFDWKGVDSSSLRAEFLVPEIVNSLPSTGREWIQAVLLMLLFFTGSSLTPFDWKGVDSSHSTLITSWAGCCLTPFDWKGVDSSTLDGLPSYDGRFSLPSTRRERIQAGYARGFMSLVRSSLPST